MKHIITALAIWGITTTAVAADKLIVISPHRKSIQDEFIPKFKEHYKAAFKTDVEVEWIDQGGTADDVKFVRAKFQKNPATTGIDIFWGGGTAVFMELAGDKLLAPYTLPKPLDTEVPQSAAGVPLFDSSKTWYASAMSSFGIFFNRKLLKMDGITEPTTWDDLADPKYKGQITLADPRRSGTANTMNTIILQALGWDKGFDLLTRIAGNNRIFTHSSSDPIKAVVSGDASASMVIDFYAVSKIADLGKDNLGFIMPPGQTILDPDPVAILKGAPNRTVAERFVNYVLSPEAQKLLILPKGAEGGPKLEALGRMAINTTAYAQTEGKRATDFNPFKQKAFLKLDLAKAAKMQRVFNDLIGAIHIDTHGDLKEAWAAIVKGGMKADDLATFAKPPVNEAELLALSDKWDDDVFRNKTINTWVEASKSKYKKLASK
jgi:iron(III) transport system substrate-binding protein